MKDLIIALVAICIFIAPPYLFVGLIWIFSIAGFDYQVTVTSDVFYIAATLYWITIGWLPAWAWAMDRTEW
jgi:hypothetical protein